MTLISSTSFQRESVTDEIAQEPVGLQGRALPVTAQTRVTAAGKFFQVGEDKWYLKGFTYGPFAPGADGEYLPECTRLLADLRQMRALGANCLRLYHAPPRWFLDFAGAHDLRVFVDAPWEKHRCFFEDYAAQQAARDSIKRIARELGDHPALFAISVANELPCDVVRFYGRRRVGKFVDELIDVAKQHAPDALATFANYPSTEFLESARRDFLCFNIYLEKLDALSAYLDRLQHFAGAVPLVLGEYGADSFRQGEEAQESAVDGHVQRVFRHGLAGSFVFSFTDDWFTGGHQIKDWAFGVTRADRSEKPAAEALKQAWQAAPRVASLAQPPVSVVVCSYNGAALLEECLTSLVQLNYPDYEIILVDDGSTDDTPAIAARFPSVRYIRQDNMGLSYARNVGAQAASGEIVCYTDSDCVADKDWLYYLIDAMQRLEVDAIGGPNLPPPSDCWIAQCVAASPGGPSHVMIDDRFAEHVPGCNMAFRRSTLLGIGGFDAQFRQAGDDVDICWRLIDEGHKIGYAPSAVVWHHRRHSARAYFKQQKGYGRSEAMLAMKHPARINAMGCLQWKGVIYGEGAVGLPMLPPLIYHGRHGSALFQLIYPGTQYSVWTYFTLLEWHVAAAFLVVLALLFPPLGFVAAGMWMLTLFAAMRSAVTSPLSRRAPWWCKPLVFAFNVLQPVIRSRHRYGWRFSCKRAPMLTGGSDDIAFKEISTTVRDAYWESDCAKGRTELLAALEARFKEVGWPGIFHEEWHERDMLLFCNAWHKLAIRTATEELGWPKRFTRARCIVKLTRFSQIMLLGVGIFALVALATRHNIPALLSIAALAAMEVRVILSRRRAFRAVAHILGLAGRDAALKPFAAASPDKQPAFAADEIDEREMESAVMT